jgi:hypothetical protein
VPGLTDESKPRLRGPKRASKIRKLFNLTKEDDVRKYVNVFRKVRGAGRAGLPISLIVPQRKPADCASASQPLVGPLVACPTQ